MLESRIVRLEKRIRRLQILATAAIVAGLLPWLAGSKEGGEDVVRAKEFSLVDGEGEVRATWAISKDGKCKLMVTGGSEKGAPTAALTANAEGASVQIEHGQAQGALLVSKDGATFATFRDGKIEWARPPYAAVLQER